MADSEDPRLKATKAMIRSVLMSVKEGVAASRFLPDYQDITGETIPYKQLGHSSVAEFVKSIPDVVCVRPVHGELTYFAVADQSTQHLQNLIQRQKSNPKKSKSFKKGQSRFPKAHSQVSRRSAQSGGSIHKKGPPQLRPLSSHVSGFRRQRPILGKTPVKARSPLLSTPFGMENFSPLTVTVRSRPSNGEDERLIERRKEEGNGGKHMVHRALKAAVGQRSQDKMNSARTYEMAPRFKRLLTAAPTDNTATTNNAASNVNASRPVAGGQNSEGSLPSSTKSWTDTVLKTFPNGLWLSRFSVLYKERFGTEPPDDLFHILQSWTEIVRLEKNEVANRYLLYPASEAEETEVRSTKSSGYSSDTTESAGSSKPSSTPDKKHWENCHVPNANLFEVGEMTEAYASYSVGLSEFYLQEADSCAEDITDMIQAVQQELPVPTADDMQPGVYCAALYSEDDSWYRARVLYLHSNTQVEVFFVDYGNTETVPLSDIRCLTPEIANTPAQIVCCAMFALKPFDGPDGWSQEAKDMFNSLISSKKLEVQTYGIEEGKCVVELWTEDSEQSLNEQLYNSELVDTYLPLDPPDLEIPQDGFVEVIVAFIDYANCFLRLIGKEYSEKLEAFEESLSSVYKDQKDQAKRLQEGSVCIAHSDLLFHRVKVTELQDNQANCFFVDHGYTEVFPLDQLVPLDKEVNQSLPYQAVSCVLVGLDQYMSNLTTITELVERARGKICVAEIIDREPLKVMLYDTHSSDDVNINEEIAKVLSSEGLNIDFTLFTPTSDSASEGSRASSPPPVTSTTTVDQLQQTAENLTLRDKTDAPTADSSAEKDSAVAVPSNVGTPKPAAVVRTVSGSDTEAIASQSAGVAPPGVVGSSPYSDSLCVAYDTWPLPSYVPHPEEGQFFDVFVYSVSDPSNFVVIPHNMLAKLVKMMQKMNATFSPELGQGSGDTTGVKKPTVVPDPHVHHMYMVLLEGAFYRALYISVKQSMYHVLLPDYCEHALVEKDQLYFLPKTFWSLPFAAFRATLYGVKPSGEKSSSVWQEAVKYKFTQLTLHKTLVALLKKVEGVGERGTGEGGEQVVQVSKQKMVLHLIDTSQEDTDVIIADVLLACPFGVVTHC